MFGIRSWLFFHKFPNWSRCRNEGILPVFPRGRGIARNFMQRIFERKGFPISGSPTKHISHFFGWSLRGVFYVRYKSCWFHHRVLWYVFSLSWNFKVIRVFPLTTIFSWSVRGSSWDSLESVFKLFCCLLLRGQVFLKVKDAFLIHVPPVQKLSSLSHFLHISILSIQFQDLGQRCFFSFQ